MSSCCREFRRCIFEAAPLWCRVPHPGRVLCGQGGKPQIQICPVSNGVVTAGREADAASGREAFFVADMATKIVADNFCNLCTIEIRANIYLTNQGIPLMMGVCCEPSILRSGSLDEPFPYIR